MEAVTGATSSLLPKLGALLQEEYKLQDKVKVDIESLQKELIFMNATLLMVAEAPPGTIDPLVKTWASLIRELSYDMEDVVNTFMAEVHSKSIADLGRLKALRMKVFNMLCMGTTHHRIAGMIQEMKSLTKELTGLRDRYRLDNICTGPATTVPLPQWDNNALCDTPVVGARRFSDLLASPRLINTMEPVGAVRDMKKLMDWLYHNASASEKHASVLSIVGFGGIGKTTLATAFYREVRNEFDCRASVTVSQNYDEDQILRDILGQINPQDWEEQKQQGSSTRRSLEENLLADNKSSVKKFVPVCGHRYQGKRGSGDFRNNKIETMDHDQLVIELRRRLNGKRYLLLIDDIWSAETWDNIRNWLPHDNTEHSRIIVTTRFQAVGAACSQRDIVDRLHTVSVLSEVESDNLFHQAFSEAESSTGNQRLSAGLQAAGGLCSEENSTGHTHTVDCLTDADFKSLFAGLGVSDSKLTNGIKIWKFCGGLPLAIVALAGLVACNPTKSNDHWSKVSKSFFSEQAAPLTLEGVTRILDYCYNNLPADLKTCSLYLSIFPKGSVISRKRLTRRWISECFVTGMQGKTAEEVAEIYFNQLIRRKIIRPVQHSSSGKVKSFKVHDMILEYIVSKSIEENFIIAAGGHWLMPTSSNKVRRLSIQSSGSKDGNSTKGMNLSHVRSLTVFGSQNHLPFDSFNYGVIEVLDLESWKGLTEKHLNAICKMARLKYLSLRRTEVAEIPSKIEKLQYLESLDIRETNVGELPKTIGQLKLLRSVHGGSKNPRKSLKLPQEKNNEPMRALRILSGIEITEDSAAVASLHQLTGLRKLAIYKLNIQEGSKTFKQLVSSIEYLCSCGLQTLAINDEGSEFINSLDSMSAPPRYLIALELSGKMEKPPKWIENLSNLYKLTLSVTVLKTDTFKLIQNLTKLFSLTFTLSAKKDDRDIVDILEENKQLTGREIIIPPKGFTSLKLLRFFATVIPRLSFADTGKPVMPALERIDMEFQAFEGIYGIENLERLQELHLSFGNQADEITKFLVDDLKDTTKFFNKKDTTKWPKIITD